MSAESANEIEPKSSQKTKPTKGRKKVAPESRVPKIKYSKFFVTLNTNRPVTPTPALLEDPLYINFDRSCDEIFSGRNIGDYIWIKEEGVAFDDKIKSIDYEYIIEWGPINNCIHCHANIVIRHYTVLMLDRSKIYNKIIQDTGLGSFRLDIRTVRTDAERLEDYMNKSNPDAATGGASDTNATVMEQ